jgi:hypothetical protein
MLERPNEDYAVDELIYALLFETLGVGMGFGWVSGRENTGAGRAPTTMTPVPTDVVTLQPRTSWAEPATWLVDGEPTPLWPLGPLWVMRGYPRWGTPVSLSPLGLARLTTSIGLGARDFAYRWFRDGNTPTGVLVYEGDDPNMRDSKFASEVATAAARAWDDGAAGTRRTRALTSGWRFVAQQVRADESQFLDTIAANATDVARFYGVMPEDIGAAAQGGGSVTYANVEQRNIQLLARTIGPWVVRLERRLSMLRPPGREVRFDLSALLRTDTNTLINRIDKEIRLGTLSRDEARAMFDRPAIPDGTGGEHLWPPYRSQLSNPEVERGADGDAEA